MYVHDVYEHEREEREWVSSKGLARKNTPIDDGR